MITPKNIERLKTITFVLPMGGEHYLPQYADTDTDPEVKYIPRTVTSVTKMTRSTSFPWNEEENVLRPLSNGVYMQNNGPQISEISVDAQIVDEYTEGEEDVPGETEPTPEGEII